MFLIALVVVSNIFLAQGNTLGFYWRDFDGTIPEDAFVAGTTRFNKPIYIGQALYSGMLIPGTIYQNDKTVYFEYGGWERQETENVKIFCTDAPDQFEWMRTDTNHITAVSKKLIFKAGFESSSTSIYIGRTRAYGEVLVGKVVSGGRSDGIYVVRKGNVKSSTNNFEVLSYKQTDEVQQPSIIVR
ncbi:hypothetical protein PPYR_14364 [Photinus pyralis]|uniref:Uncharacterized protein n=2 Tax=Photinus pyralis TaxID=7054 RepID=A0A5N4A504_PHOPY|nr:uncharacterized protein LOC116180926 [Photinus pyralis]KAB0792405.1 hypothetical protein PPYR_14364 [Photinus pyralis]